MCLARRVSFEIEWYSWANDLVASRIAWIANASHLNLCSNSILHRPFIGVIMLIGGDHFITWTDWFWCQAMSNGKELLLICQAVSWRYTDWGLAQIVNKYIGFQSPMSHEKF